MKTNWLKLAITSLFFTTIGYAQVGVGTTTPRGSFEVNSTTQGMVLPSVALTSKAVEAPVINPAGGALAVNTLVYNTATAGIAPNNVVPGYYYWSGSQWVLLSTGNNSDWSLTGNGGTTAGTNFLGTTDAQDVRFKTNNIDRFNISNANNGQLQSYSLGTAALPTYSYQGDQNTGIFSPAADNLAITTNGTEKVRVIANGNTGIGTIAPQRLLNVNSSATTIESSTLYSKADSGLGLFVGIAANPDPYTGGGSALNGKAFVHSTGGQDLQIATTSANNIEFGTNGTNRMFINSIGNVGIGTTTPAGKLDITSTTDGIVIPRVALTATNAAAPLTAPTTSELVYNTATAGVAPNNVTPGYYYWDGTKWVNLATGANNDWSLTGNAGTNAATNFVGTTDAVDFVTRTNNTEKTRITSAGNMGIGTTTPISKLSVAGGATIGATYAPTNVAPTNGLRVQGQSVIGKVSGEDARDIFSSHSSATAFSNITGYPSVAGKRAIAGYSDAGGMGVLGYSNSNGFGVVGLTQPSVISAFVQTGEGVLGQADGGAAGIPIGVHGIIDETAGGNTRATPVLGENNTNTVGSGFQGGAYATNKAIAGVYGNIGSRVPTATTNAYMFGVVGDILMLGGTIPDGSGGILGAGGTGQFGMLGYQGLTGTLYSVYGGGASGSVGAGNAGNKGTINEPNNHVGLGINGGFMGGFVKGNQYGMMSKGSEFGMYVQGNTIVNQPIVQLTENNTNERTATYFPSSTEVDVTTRGIGKLNNGEAFISFKEAFKNIVSDKEPINVTITPTGETNGVYISNVTKEGFYVKENLRGTSNATFNWVAIGTKNGFENGVELSKTVLATDFDKNMDGVMSNDGTGKEGTPVYFDGQNVKFERMPEGFKRNQKKEASKKR